jgi:hypothetical protein
VATPDSSPAMRNFGIIRGWPRRAPVQVVAIDMKIQIHIRHGVLVFLAAALAACLCSCGRTDSSSNNAASKGAASGNNAASSSAASNSIPASKNQNVSSATSFSAANANSPGAPKSSSSPQATPELVGTYEIQEVHKQGVVSVMTELKTSFTFNQDSTYFRVSTIGGKPYHRDSGDFKIVPPDKLVLSIKLSGRNIQQPPKEETHKFVLSQGGDDLRLTSSKGPTAVFKRTAKPTAK